MEDFATIAWSCAVLAVPFMFGVIVGRGSLTASGPTVGSDILEIANKIRFDLKCAGDVVIISHSRLISEGKPDIFITMSNVRPTVDA